MAVPETRQETPQKLDSSNVLDTAMRIGWRYKGTLLALVICLTIVFTTLSCGLALLLPSSFHPNGEFNPGAVFTIAFRACCLLVPMLLQAVLLDVYVGELQGRRPAPGSCLRSATRAAIPALALGILILLAVIIGGVFFLVPGIMLFVALFVAIPAQRMEGGSINNAINRSLDLTKGRRWEVFSLVFNLAMWSAIAYGMVMGFLVIGNQLAEKLPDLALAVLAAQAVVLFLLLPFIWLLWGFGHAIAYVVLRRFSEGDGPDFLTPEREPAPTPEPDPA